jgi:hypothetical protein
MQCHPNNWNATSQNSCSMFALPMIGQKAGKTLRLEILIAAIAVLAAAAAA